MVEAIQAVAEYLRLRGITAIPERRYEAHWMEQMDATRWQGKTEAYDEPDPERLMWNYRDQLVKLPPVGSLDNMLKSFADSHGGFPVSAEFTDAAPRVLQAYLCKSGSLDADKQIARQVVRDYCADLSSPTITVVSLFQVEQFSAVQPFELSDEVTFRPLSHEDIKEQAKRQFLPIPSMFQRPLLNSDDWVCEVKKKGPKDTYDAVNWDIEGRRHIAATLALTSPGAARFTLLSSRHQSPFFTGGIKSGWESTLTGPGAKHLQIGAEHIELARNLSPRVVSILTEKDRSCLRLPLERLLTAAQRRNAEDQLVDYVIGLESLVAPDTDRLEVTVRFRLRGAAITPPHLGNPGDRIKLMNKLYDLRSRCVHGDAQRQEVLDCIPKAEDALRQVLLWYMSNSLWGREPKSVITDLDKAMVKGGSHWARSFSGEHRSS